MKHSIAQNPLSLWEGGVDLQLHTLVYIVLVYAHLCPCFLFSQSSVLRALFWVANHQPLTQFIPLWLKPWAVEFSLCFCSGPGTHNRLSISHQADTPHNLSRPTSNPFHCTQEWLSQDVSVFPLPHPYCWCIPCAFLIPLSQLVLNGHSPIPGCSCCHSPLKLMGCFFNTVLQNSGCSVQRNHKD